VRQKDKKKEVVLVEGHCVHADTCPLSHVQAGVTVCIKELATEPDLTSRLREMGLGEERQVRLVSHATNIICEVCNARLGISRQLAEKIMVQPMNSSAKSRS
jgi:Fe2+ transport system protein FeoA